MALSKTRNTFYFVPERQSRKSSDTRMCNVPNATERKMCRLIHNADVKSFLARDGTDDNNQTDECGLVQREERGSGVAALKSQPKVSPSSVSKLPDNSKFDFATTGPSFAKMLPPLHKGGCDAA